MDVSARLRDFPVLVLLAVGLLVSASCAQAGDALVINQPLPTLRSLVARAHLQSLAPAATASTEPICDIFANGYDPVGTTPCAGCFDSTLDFDETDIDCGGVYCKACADGQHCAVGGDCSSTVCNTATTVCAPATCADGINNGTETAVDCGGGTCPGCVNGLSCAVDADCLSNACDALSLKCVSDQCFDHRQDGLETDFDCGGGICSACASGMKCSDNTDCASKSCDFVTGTCAFATCTDGIKNGAETDVDCGGADACGRCFAGQTCLVSADCASGLSCSNSVCQ